MEYSSASRNLEARVNAEDQPLILVADDNRVNRMVVHATFQDMDYRIVEAATGREAVDKALDEPPDLVLMDLMMPEMDGLEATRILKNDERTDRIPILMLTALSETEDRISAFDAGATGFLTKPFDRLELMANVRSYINLSEVNRKYVLSTANPNTGLPNRAAFRDELPSYKTPLLLLLKIDNVDTIGRFYGESKVAHLERRFAGALPGVAERHDLHEPELFHFSSGLFGILVDLQLPRQEALELAESIHAALIEAGKDWDDLQYESDFTIGVSVDADALLEHGELAVNEDVNNRVNVVYAPDIAEQAYSVIESNMVWLRKIRNGLSEDRFVPYFQPIVNNETGRTEKFEALLRMLDEDDKAISPGAFLTVAKNSKYYARVTQVMIQKAVEVFRDREEGLTINLSVLDIENEETREFIVSILRSAPRVAHALTIEIVEEEGFAGYDEIKRFIRRVKELGVTIAIDDFGSGYSNFARIVDLDVDFIKIDGTLIRNVADDPVIRNLVVGIKSFAAFSNIAVVAEFVEDDRILDAVKAAGIEYSQGYHFCKPQATPKCVNISTGNSGVVSQ